MNVIIVAKFLKTPKKLNFRQPRTVAALGLALALVASFGGGIGWLLRGPEAGARAELDRMQAELVQQQGQLQQARADAEREIDALAARVAELQASATRLNALGERLTRLGKIEEGEFDFAEPPAVGGPAEADELAQVEPGELLGSISTLEDQFAWQAEQFSLLESMILDQNVDMSLTPGNSPVRVGYASSGYGYRTDPFTGRRAFHGGMDFSGPRGSDVLAAADGVVSFAGRRSGYGNVVEIDHGNGYITRYAHNSSNLGKPGQRVRAGEVIAKMGSTGRSTGSHVHFEVLLNDRPVNPRQYLQNSARG